MPEYVRTYSIKPTTAPTTVASSAATTQTPSNSPPHPFFRRVLMDERAEEISQQRDRFNSLLRAAARKPVTDAK